MASMYHEMKTGRSNDSNEEYKKLSQVTYRHPLSSHEEIRRASEQTSPQVARAVGDTQKWDNTANWAVAAAQFAVFISSPKLG